MTIYPSLNKSPKKNLHKIVDTTVKESLTLINSYSKQVTFVTFSPNGLILASLLDKSILKLWDLKTSEHYTLLDRHDSYLTMLDNVAFSPDGLLIAAAMMFDRVAIWDMQTRERLRLLSGEANVVAFSPDGLLLASAGKGDIMLRDVKTGELVRTLVGHSSTMNHICFCFSPDGCMLASASDKTVKLWDVGTGVVSTILCKFFFGDLFKEG